MAFIAPLIAGAVGALGVSAAAASFIGSVGALVLGIGASLAVNAIFAKKGTTAETVSGTDGTVKLGGDVARQIVFGVAATSGHLVYVNSYGASNAHEQEVYVLADWRCDAFVGIIVDGVSRGMTAMPTLYGEDARYWIDGFGDKLEMRFYAGRPSQAADAGLIAAANPAGRWTAAHRGDGICYVVVDKTYDADLFSGFPTFKFIVQGARLYDWRRDGSVGGAGSHRWDDPETWEFAENPAVCLYNYQRGFVRNGAILMGQGVPSVDLPLDLYTAAANVADEPVYLAAGGSEVRYAVSAIASDEVQHRDVMEAMVNALGGWLYERAGSYAPVAGAAQSVVRTLTDADLLLEGQVRVSRKRSRSTLVNYVSGSYTSPSELWETAGYTAVSSATNEAVDGERLGKSLDFDQVTSKTRAERLALLRYNENRCQTTATIQISLVHVDLEIGDWIRWASDRYGDRTYRISDWGLSLVGGEIGLTLGLSEIANEVYGWNPLTDEAPIYSPGSSRVDGVMTRSLANFVVQASAATSALGETIPTLVVSWTPPDDQTVIAVIVEYRRLGETAAATARSDTPQTGRIEISGLLGGASHEVRGTIVTDPPRSVLWTVWHTIDTEPASFPVVVDVDQLAPGLAATIDALGTSVAGLRDTLLTTELSRITDRRRTSALVTDVRSAVVASEAATASALDVLRAEFDATTGAVASAVTDLQAEFAGSTANGNVTFTAAADQTGALARYQLWLSAVSAGSPVASAAMTLEVVSVGGVAVSQVKFATDRFFVTGTDGSSLAPFSISGGSVFMDRLQVRHQIILGSGGYGGSILIRD